LWFQGFVAFQILVKRVVFFGSKYCGDMGQDLYEQSNGEDVDFADLAEDVMGI
jgi:hypothetical protein